MDFMDKLAKEKGRYKPEPTKEEFYRTQLAWQRDVEDEIYYSEAQMLFRRSLGQAANYLTEIGAPKDPHYIEIYEEGYPKPYKGRVQDADGWQMRTNERVTDVGMFLRSDGLAYARSDSVVAYRLEHYMTMYNKPSPWIVENKGEIYVVSKDGDRTYKNQNGVWNVDNLFCKTDENGAVDVYHTVKCSDGWDRYWNQDVSMTDELAELVADHEQWLRKKGRI